MSWINEYIYLVEKYAVKNVETETGQDINNIRKYQNISHSSHNVSPNKLFIICYHISNECKYPFIQFMLEKDTALNILSLPFIEINSNIHDNLYELIVKKISKNLESSTQNTWSIKNIIYKGLMNDSYEEIYALVDISNVDIRHMQYIASNLKYHMSHIVFALASEIINVGSVYDVKINQHVKELFCDIPELGILHDPQKKKPYPLPDAIYSGSFLENAIYSSFFGPSKKYIPTIKRSCYYFDTQFENAFFDGVWSNDTFYTPVDVIDKTSRSKKYLKGGITRYALFPEEFSMVELNDDNIMISDDILDILNKYKQLYIVQRFSSIDNVKVVILVRDYDSIVSLSYCEINMKSIGDKYDHNKIQNYSLI